MANLNPNWYGLLKKEKKSIFSATLGQLLQASASREGCQKVMIFTSFHQNLFWNV